MKIKFDGRKYIVKPKGDARRTNGSAEFTVEVCIEGKQERATFKHSQPVESFVNKRLPVLPTELVRAFWRYVSDAVDYARNKDEEVFADVSAVDYEDIDGWRPTYTKCRKAFLKLTKGFGLSELEVFNLFQHLTRKNS